MVADADGSERNHRCTVLSTGDQQRRQVQCVSSAHRFDLLHADAAGADQPQRVDIDRLHIGRSIRSWRRPGRVMAINSRRDPLRFLVHGSVGQSGHQRAT